MPSKRIRFEVFKRDSFQCQYCGRTPPEVMLELDHIMPKAKGGQDIIENYVTACVDCNRGKGAVKLTDLPVALQDNLARLKEKRVQLLAYNKFLQQVAQEKENALSSVDKVFSRCFTGYVVSDSVHSSVKRFLDHLPEAKLVEAMEIACARFPRSSSNSIRYFYGICWNWIKGRNSFPLK